MRPRPTMPTVFSYSSTPVYLLRFHSPFFSDGSAAGMWRAAASSRPTASSAALTMLEVGALTTMTPAWVAALTSTLSRPTPARATTLSCLAAASASASTLVALRTRMASTSAMAGSSSARSAPLQCRISKSGPSASTVAGRELFGDQDDGPGYVSHGGISLLEAVGAHVEQSTALCPLIRSYLVRSGAHARDPNAGHSASQLRIGDIGSTSSITSLPPSRTRSYLYPAGDRPRLRRPWRAARTER